MERLIKNTSQNDFNFFSKTIENKFDNFQKTKFIPTDPNLEEIKKILDKKPITEFALQKALELYDKVVDKEKFSLPTLRDEKTNEVKDNPYISYIELLEGFELYKENLPIVKKLLREKTIYIFKLNDVKAKEAIQAYKLLDECGSFYVDLFYRSYPFLADTMDTALPVEFRKQSKSAFQKGFQEKEYDAKDPLKETRDNRKALFSDIEKELNKELEGKLNALELLLAIVVEAGLETQELQEKLKNAPFNPDKKNLLEQKYPSAFDITLLNSQKPQNIEDGVETGTHNRGMFAAGVNAVGLEAVNQGLINIFLGKKGSLKDIDLTKFQSNGAGTLGGMEFVRDDTYTKEEYETWLQTKGIIKNEEDKKFLNKLDAGEIAFKTDLKDEKKKEDGRKNHLTAFANALPFASLNYLAGDMAVRSDEGVLKHLFFKMEWEALKKNEQEKNEIAQIDVLLQEASFNNLRIIFDNETYGIGKLSLKDVKIDAKQLIEKAGEMSDLMELSGKLIPLFKNLSVLAVAVVQQLIGRFRGEPSLSESSKGLQQVLSEGFLEYTGLNLTTSDVIVENFYSTSMGRIGKIGLGATTMKMQGKTPSENIEPAFQSEKTNLKGLKKQYQELLKKRAKSRHEDADLNKEIEKLYEQINAEEAKLLEKEGNTSFAFGIETNKVKFEEAELLQEMMSKMLKESFEESGLVMEGVEGLSDFELPQGLKLGTFVDNNKTQISSEQVKNLSVDVPKIVFKNPVTASRLIYTGKEDIINEQTQQPSKDETTGKKKQKETMKVVGSDIAFTELELGMKIDFADYDKSKPPKEEDSLIKNMQINGLKAKKAIFGTFQFKQTNPFEPIKKGTKEETNFYDVLDFKDKVTFHDFDFSFDQAKEKMNLQIGKIEQEYHSDKGLHFNYLDKSNKKDEETGKDVETNIKTGGKLNIVDAGGLNYSKKGSEQNIKLEHLSLRENSLDNLYFKQGDLEIEGLGVTMNWLSLRGLDFKMDSKTGSMYLNKLEYLKIPDITLKSGFKIVNQGKTYHLKSGSLSGFEAQNLELDFQGADIFEKFKKGRVSFNHFNLSNLALDSVSKLNYFNLKDFSIESIKDGKGKSIVFDGKQSIQYHKSDKTSSLTAGAYSKWTGVYSKYEIMTKDEKGQEVGSGKYNKPHLKTDFDDFNSSIQVADKEKNVKTEIDLDKIGIKTDFETFAELDFGQYISMPRIQYESKDGMYVKGFNESGLIRLENPSAKLKLVQEEKVVDGKKTKTLKNIEIEQFHLKKIVASKLEFGKGKDANFALKNGKIGSLTDVNLSGNFRLADGAFALKGDAKEINLEELKAVFSQSVFLNPYLQADNLTFSREYNGDMEAKVHNFDMGLVSNKDVTNTQNPNQAKIEPDKMGMIYLEQIAKDKNTPVLQSHTVTYQYNKKEDRTEVIMKDPKLGAIALEGQFHGYNGSSGIVLQKMIMQGEMKGDLKYIDTPKETILDGSGFMFQIPEAHFFANEISELFQLTKPEEKKEETQNQQSFNQLFDLERLKLEHPTMAKGNMIVQYQEQMKANHTKMQAKSKEYEFLNLFGGSNFSMKMYGKTINLRTMQSFSYPDMQPNTYIDVLGFIRDIALTMESNKEINDIISHFIGSFGGNYVSDGVFMDKVMKNFSKSIKNTFEGTYGSMFMNFKQTFISQAGKPFRLPDSYISLPHFAFFMEQVMGDMQNITLKNLVKDIIPDLVNDLVDKVGWDVALKIVGATRTPTGFIIGGVVYVVAQLSKPYIVDALIDYLNKKIDAPASTEVNNTDEFIKDPDILQLVKHLLYHMQPEINMNISGTNKGANSKINQGELAPYINSELTKGFETSGALSLKFFKTLQLEDNNLEKQVSNYKNQLVQKQDNTRVVKNYLYRPNTLLLQQPTLSLNNFKFNGFSYPLLDGKGKLSTESMGIDELILKKQSFKKTGAVDLDAKNVYLKGFKLVINKPQEANKQKKTGK